jgi:hypothetical protein
MIGCAPLQVIIDSLLEILLQFFGRRPFIHDAIPGQTQDSAMEIIPFLVVFDVAGISFIMQFSHAIAVL